MSVNLTTFTPPNSLKPAMSGLRVVVVGGQADRERASKLMEAMSGEPVDLVGKTSLGELAQVFRGAAIVLTNDTSGVHIGAAVDVPRISNTQ